MTPAVPSLCCKEAALTLDSPFSPGFGVKACSAACFLVDLSTGVDFKFVQLFSSENGGDNFQGFYHVGTEYRNL